MKLLHLRNATTLLEIGGERLLVDPMLSPAGALPSLRLTGERRANPLVALPPVAAAALAGATAAIVTHEHPDHLDRAGVEFLRSRRLPVWASGVDVPNLRRKGLDARVLADGALGMRVETVRSRHARGLLGFMLGPACGFYLAHPDEPSIYVVGDSVLTESVVEAIGRLQPDVVLVPAGGANMGFGGDVLFSLDELVEIARLAHGTVVFNHLDAIDHCAVTRAILRERMKREGLDVRVPEDGEELTFAQRERGAPPPVRPSRERPGLQKWLTERLVAGT